MGELFALCYILIYITHDWVRTCTQKYGILELKNKEYKVLKSTAIVSGYAVVIHKEGLVMEAFLASSLLGYKEWLKFFF